MAKCPTGKIKHMKKQDAEWHRFSLMESPHYRGEFLDVYKCPNCHTYHVGRVDKGWRCHLEMDPLQPCL